MCSVSEKSRSNAPYSIESASCDYRQGHWRMTRSGYITTERDGYFGEFAAGKPHDLHGRGRLGEVAAVCRESPPATNAYMAWAQWSRPPAVLIIGVRPSSPAAMRPRIRYCCDYSTGAFRSLNTERKALSAKPRCEEMFCRIFRSTKRMDSATFPAATASSTMEEAS